MLIKQSVVFDVEKVSHIQRFNLPEHYYYS